MNSADARSKYGLILVNSADEPAAPAARRNGNMGMQHVDASMMLASAATLATIVRFERLCSGSAATLFRCRSFLRSSHNGTAGLSSV